MSEVDIRPGPLVSIVIPSRDRKKQLSRLIRSVLECDYGNFELIVVDDYSGGPLLNFGGPFPNVRVIRNPRQRQLSASRNVGAMACKGDAVFFVDDDNVIDSSCISELVAVMMHDPTIGVAAPIMYFLRDPRRIWWAGTNRSGFTGTTRYVGNGQLDFGQFRQVMDTFDCPNAFLVRGEIGRKLGWFDSLGFSSTFSEADFCLRIRGAGCRVVVAPTAKLWHDVPTPARPRFLSLMLRDTQRAFNLMRGAVVFHRKHSGGLCRPWFLLFLLPTHLIVYSLSALCNRQPIRERLEKVQAYFRGVAAGLQHKLPDAV